MKILSFFLTVSVATVYFSHAQHINTSFADAMEIRKRILLVALQDEYFLAQHPGVDSLEAVMFRNDIEGQRKSFKKAVSEHWKFNDSIVVLSENEAKSLMKQFPEKYALMKVDKQKQYDVYFKANSNTPLSQTAGWSKYNDSLVYNYVNRYGIMMLGITSVVIELPRPVANVYLPKVSPSEGDFIFALHQLEYILTATLKAENYSSNKIYKDSKKLSDQLKNKTLLLDRRELACKEEDIAKVYPYPFKIVSYETIENALKTRDSESITIQSLKFDLDMSVLCLNNTGDGTVYGYLIIPTFNYGYGAHGSMTIRVTIQGITLKHLEKFCKVK